MFYFIIVCMAQQTKSQSINSVVKRVIYAETPEEKQAARDEQDKLLEEWKTNALAR